MMRISVLYLLPCIIFLCIGCSDTDDETTHAQTILSMEDFIKKYHKGNFIVSGTNRATPAFEDDPLFPKIPGDGTLTPSEVFFQIENTESLGDILGRLKGSGMISFFEVSPDNVLTIRFNQSIAINPLFIEK